MKIALVAQNATPLHPRAGSGPDRDDIGLSELTRKLAASGYPDHGACWQVAGGVVNDPQNPGAKAICKYNSGTGLYDLYVYSPADPSSP